MVIYPEEAPDPYPTEAELDRQFAKLGAYTPLVLPSEEPPPVLMKEESDA